MQANMIKKTIFMPFLIIEKNTSVIPYNCVQFKSIFENKVVLVFIDVSSGFSFKIICPPQVAILYTSKNLVGFLYKPKWFGGKWSLSQLTFKVIFNTLLVICFGTYRSLQFIGFRFRQRWFRNAQVIRYKIGYNKRVWLRAPDDFVSIIRKISPKKRTHLYVSRDIPRLRELVRLLYVARPRTLYKGRGVNVKEQPMVLKEGKKTLW